MTGTTSRGTAPTVLHTQPKPYPYQEACLEAIERAQEEGKRRALVLMASGLGKTMIAALDVSRYLRQHRDGRVLFLCHQNDILQQARQTFTQVLGPNVTTGFFRLEETNVDEVQCLFASFQMMHGWHETFPPDAFDYIVVDETHHIPARTYLPTLEYFEPRFLLGLTATLERMDLKDIRSFYGAETFSLPLELALVQGLLASVDYRLITDEISLGQLPDVPAERLSIRALNRYLFVPKRDEEIVRIVEEHAAEIDDARMMIFCPSVEYCERLAPLIAGSATMHYQLARPEQEQRLQRFRRGEIRVLLCVDRLNEGIDVPEVNLVVFLRSTASRRIFLQQLGRGLRKVEGKDEVRVLDFVANCERLEMVQQLWNEVQERVREERPEAAEQDSMVINVGNIEFDEVAQDVLQIISVVRTGYTREVLLSQGQRLAEELGGRLSVDDVQGASREGKIGSLFVIYKYFGSFPTFLEALGLPVLRKGSYTPAELLDQGRRLTEGLGRTPTAKDVQAASKRGEIGSVATIYGHFGSFNTYLEVLGLPENQRRFHGNAEEELLEQIRALSEELGRPPRVADVRRAFGGGKCASPTTFHKHFGVFGNVLRRAGVATEYRRRIPKRRYLMEEILQHLRDLERSLGRMPTTTDVGQASKDGRGPSLWVYYSRFESFGAALEAAGLKEMSPVG